MKDRELIELVDRLRGLPTETEWCEFKKNHVDPQQLGEYLSALANSACLKNQPRGYLIFGIDDESHEVVGSSYDPYAVKGKGNQDLLPWMNIGLQPNLGVDVYILDHPKGRIVVFEIAPARDQPVSFYGTAYVRIGTSKTELRNHPEKARLLWTQGSDWSAEICEQASMADLDPDAIIKAREQFIVKHPAQAGDVAAWDDLTFLNKARILKHGAVTNTALLLLGRNESTTLLTPAVAMVSWILKDANNKELDYEHFGPPFLLAGDRMLERLRNLTVRTLPGGTLFPKEMTQYDAWVIREALYNGVAHQDYRLRGRITVVEFPDRVLLGNVGDFLPGSIKTVIEQDAPQSVYRNPFLANAMMELNLIDIQGGGIKRMFETQRKRSFPMPDYDLEKPGHVSVSIFGRILDERYTRLLMERTDLTLAQVMLLDRVQKRQEITLIEHQQLKTAGLIEGRFPNTIVSGTLAKTTGDVARHIREKGLNKKYYLDMIVELVARHGPVGRKEVDELLLPKLSDRMNEQQKVRKVHNLLQELRKTGMITNCGTRAEPKWMCTDSGSDRGK